MGRWKMGPNGGYWDGQDSGPDQMQPTPEMMQAAGQGSPAGGVPPSGQQPMPGMENGGVTGGEPYARFKWERDNPGVPFPGMKAMLTPDAGGPTDGMPMGTEPKQLPNGPMGPVDIMPGEGGQWNMGGQPYDFRSMLEALKGQFGGQMRGGAALGGAIGMNSGTGGGLMGAIKNRIAPTAGGAPMMGAPQQSLSSMLQKRDPNEQMNLGAIGGAY